MALVFIMKIQKDENRAQEKQVLENENTGSYPRNTY